MEQLQLKGTSLKVSPLCLGTMTFGKPADEHTASRLVDMAIDAGINFFDTANAYQAGVSEAMLGKALRGRRDKCIVATKVFNRMGDGPHDAGLSRQAILKAVEDSLRRLGMEYIDLYYLHQPDYTVPIDESLEALDALIKAGKIRFSASSNYSAWQIVEMLERSRELGFQPPAVSQSMYNLLARGLDQEFLPMAKHCAVSVIAYNPLAGGLLTGKYSQEAAAPGTRFEDNKMYRERYWHAQDFEAIAKLAHVAEEAGRSLVSLALGWLLHHTPVDCVVLGASQPEQLQQNLAAAAEGPLPAEAVAACDSVWHELRGPVPTYNR